MSDVIIFDRMQQRRGTLANLEAVNEVLLEGEFCVILDTGEMKIGDGATPWNSLPYFNTDKVPEGTRLYFTNQRVYDTVKAMLVEGSNVTITADDEELTITISATGGGGGGFPEGDSFPGSPATGQKFYRTDLNMLFYYDGTLWLTVQEFSLSFGGTINSADFAAYLPVRQGFQFYLTRFTCVTFVSGTSNGSNYWTVAISWRTEANADTLLLSFATAADTGLNWINHDHDIDEALPSTTRALRIAGNKTGSPGGLYTPITIYYRLIVT